MKGVLLVDKSVGVTSHDVVRMVRRMFPKEKVGHAGTLDPFASGLLPILIGRETTKRVEEIMSKEKEYVADIRFGSETETCDFTGRVTARSESYPISESQIKGVLQSFVGLIEQEPPQFSAIKYMGRPLYWYARNGIRIEIPKRKCQVFSIILEEYLPPDGRLRVICGKGTYVRALARDIGRKLSCFAHLIGLRRIRVGDLRIEDAVPLWKLREGIAVW